MSNFNHTCVQYEEHEERIYSSLDHDETDDGYGCHYEPSTTPITVEDPDGNRITFVSILHDSNE